MRAHVVAVRRALESGRRPVSVPWTHPPDEEAEVDFGMSWIDGALNELAMFVVCQSHSGRAFRLCRVSEGQHAAFLEGHVARFENFGRVPARIYQTSSKAAVADILVGRRIGADRFTALRSHMASTRDEGRPPSAAG